MNEILYHSPGQQADLAARHEGIRESVAASRRGHRTEKPAAPTHGGLAAIAALFGARPRHRAA